MKYSLFLVALLTYSRATQAHDTWVETNTNIIRKGDATYVSFKLGNHGNAHRDFKLAGKPKLESSTLEILAPSGAKYDLKSTLIDEGYTPNEGFFTTRFVATEPGLYLIAHTSDAIVSYAPQRSVRSAKTCFVCSESLDRVSQGNPGFDRALGHVLEIIPITNPVTPMGPGQPIEVEVRFQGKPLPESRVSFIPRGVELTAEFDSRHEKMTDDQGHAHFEPKGGNVYLIVTHYEDMNAAGEGYTSTKYSATLTLFVPEICPCCGE